MGMFDDVKVEYPIPGKAGPFHCQTKVIDLDEFRDMMAGPL